MRTLAGSFVALFAAGSTISSAAQGVYGTDGNPAQLPTGQFVTPTIVQGSRYERLSTGLRPDGNADADSAMTSAISPDGKTLLVLTSGFNCCTNFETPPYSPINLPALYPLTGLPAPLSVLTGTYNGAQQAEFLFVFDISHPSPLKEQVIPIRSTYNGLAWDPAGGRFYVSGSVDDRILVYKNTVASPGIAYAPDAPFITLNHNPNPDAPITGYNGGALFNTPVGQNPVYGAGPDQYGLGVAATVAGFALSKDGKTLVAANFHNASASIVNTTTRKVIHETLFTPPGTTATIPIPGMNATGGIGEMPFWVVVKSLPSGAYSKAYVTSQRDSQVVVLDAAGSLTRAIQVPSGPGKAVLDAANRYLYVTCGNDDSVAVIDTVSDTLVRIISIARPGDIYKGAIPNSVALSPDGKTLYVTLGGENAVAVVDIASGSVLGRIPTAWLPTSVSVSADGKFLYVVNEKSNAGPNPGNVYYSHNTPYGISTNPTLRNEYTWELEKSGLTTIPVPSAQTLSSLSGVVDRNNNFGNRHAFPIFTQYLQGRIKHVIYIVNENRTYDQVLGDLPNGANGDPRLTFFTEPITPNLHNLAKNFVTLDNFYDSSETSGVGWNWVMQGHTNDYVEKTQPVDYGNGGDGFTYDWQGIVNNMNLGLPPKGPPSIFATRITGVLDPSGRSTILPGTVDPSATEGSNNLASNAVGGYIWESVLRRYGPNSVRNYGWNIDLDAYSYPAPLGPKEVQNPFAAGILQSAPSTPSIQAVTDRYYRAFDQTYPDIWRIQEWNREFQGYVAHNNMPTLMVMTIPHDHTGSYGTALEGLNSPELELEDHDYAIGKLVQALTHSKYWATTAIVMLEDDPQDGQDHVEAHRSIIHVISPYTQNVGVVHTAYYSTSALRTVEDLLGVGYLGFNDANAMPMYDIFSRNPIFNKPYTAVIPGRLCRKPVAANLVPECSNPAVPRTRAVAFRHDGAWWTKVTAGLDFSKPDHVNPQYYNAILQYGITGRGKLPAKSAAALASHNYDPGDADGDGK